MRAIFANRQNIYTDIKTINFIFETLDQALLSMFLTVTGTARVTQSITALTALQNDFLT